MAFHDQQRVAHVYRTPRAPACSRYAQSRIDAAPTPALSARALHPRQPGPREVGQVAPGAERSAWRVPRPRGQHGTDLSPSALGTRSHPICRVARDTYLMRCSTEPSCETRLSRAESCSSAYSWFSFLRRQPDQDTVSVARCFLGGSFRGTCWRIELSSGFSDGIFRKSARCFLAQPRSPWETQLCSNPMCKRSRIGTKELCLQRVGRVCCLLVLTHEVLGAADSTRCCTASPR